MSLHFDFTGNMKTMEVLAPGHSLERAALAWTVAIGYKQKGARRMLPAAYDASYL
jgi:hypothetical protein